MKKPTIKALQKRIDELTATVQTERTAASTWRQSYHEANGVACAKQSEIDKVRRELESEVHNAQHARERAETTYDQLRSGVLHYFMAASNPVTAADVKKLEELQARICNAIPPRTTVDTRTEFERHFRA